MNKPTKIITLLLLLQIAGLSAYAQTDSTVNILESDSIFQKISIKLVKIVEEDSTVVKQGYPDYVKKGAADYTKIYNRKEELIGYRKEAGDRRLGYVDTAIIYFTNGSKIVIDDAHILRDLPIGTSDSTLVVRINSYLHPPHYSKLLFYNLDGKLIKEQLFDNNTRLGYPTVANNGYTVCSGLQREEDIKTIYFFSPKGEILWKYELEPEIYPSVPQISHDGNYIAFTQRQSNVREADSYLLIFNKKGGIIKNELFHENSGYNPDVEFSDNNKYLFVHSVKGLYVYESETGKLVFFNKVRVDKYRTIISEKHNILLTLAYKDEYWHLYTFNLRTIQKINDFVIEKTITSSNRKYLTKINDDNFIINIENKHFYYQIIKN